MLKKREYARIGETALREELPNGLRLTVVPKPGYRKALAFLAVNYGAVDRRFRLGGEFVDTPMGTAHFLEHRMFEMAGGVNAMTILNDRGANADAFTSGDMTAYHFECTDRFREDLELLLGFVFAPELTQEGVDRERPIIEQEIRMWEDDPEDAMYSALLRCLYAHTPLREPVAGTVESIAGVTAETLALCHRAFYTPSNMSLVVVGDVEPEMVRDTALALTPEVNVPPVERDYGPAEDAAPVELRRERAMDVGAPIFAAGAKTAADLRGRDSVRFELTASLALSSLMGAASPLYRRLYDQGLINETFGWDFENAGGVSHLTFGGETQNPELVTLKVLEEAAQTAARGLDPDYFARRKKALYGGAIRSLNSFDNICYNIAAGDFSGYDYLDTVSILDTVTPDHVRAFLDEYMTPERTAISIITKKER